MNRRLRIRDYGWIALRVILRNVSAAVFHACVLRGLNGPDQDVIDEKINRLFRHRADR